MIVKCKDNKIYYENLNNEEIEIPKDLDQYDLTISGKFLNEVLKINPDLVHSLKVVARVSPK